MAGRRRGVALVLTAFLIGALTSLVLAPTHEELPGSASGWANSDNSQQLVTSDSQSVTGNTFGDLETMVLSGRGGTILRPSSDLSDETGVGSGWFFDRDRVTTATGRSMVQRLGISVQQGDMFNVRDDAIALFSAYFPRRQPQDCPGTDTSCNASLDENLPSRESISRDAEDLMRSAGLDPAQFVWEVYREGHTIRGAATLRLGAARIPLRWVFDYSVDGLYSLTGFLAPPVEITGYQLVGAATAAKRSADSRWAGVSAIPLWEPPTSDPTPTPLGQRFDELVEALYTNTTDQPSRHAGRPVLDPGTSEVVVVDAEMSLFLYRGVDGTPLLLPSWLLRTENGEGWYVPAIADEYVALPAR